MTILVADILTKAALGKERISPVDIVMGDDWGEVDLGSSLRLSLLGLMLRKQQELGAAYLRGGSPALRHVPFQVVRGGRQAMVKVIRNGGTTNARGMRDQMSYLEKDGEAKLERSDSFFGMELDAQAQEDLIEAWGLDRPSNTKSDKTTHFVVSFPSDTDHDAAYRAGRAWAEEMFASGNYGDVYDYYTAFHTDRAHPHTHVVVNRRGLENGDWLKVSKRSHIDYDELRIVQAKFAEREGILLEVSPRLARGMTDRSIPDGEVRRAEREGRKPEAPSHSPVTAIKAAAMVALYSQQYLANADLLQDKYPETADALRETAQTILSGKQVSAPSQQSTSNLSEGELDKQRETIMSRRSDLLEGFEKIDTELASVPMGPERAELERRASAIKADVAGYLPDVEDLQVHNRANLDGYYQGIKAEDGIEMDAKSRAESIIGKLAESAGIDPEKFLSRFEGSEPASQGLADQWRKDELEDIQQNLSYEGKPGQDRTSQSDAEQLAQTAYDELHRNALQTYRQAERELEVHRARKRELARIAKLVKEGGSLTGDINETFSQTMKDTLHANELKQLEAGNPEALKHVTDDVDGQRALSRRYLEAEVADAEGARKLQLQTALAKVDRDMAETSRSLNKDRGMDY